MTRGLLWCVVTIVCISTAARGEEKLTRLERPGFTIDVPHHFIVSENPGEAALEVWAPPATDKRGLSWDMSILVQHNVGGNPKHVPIDQLIQPIAKSIRESLGADLLGGPAVVPGDIASADGARLIIYRTKEKGLQFWRYELIVTTGDDIYVVSAFLNGRAGSEVLHEDYPAGETLRSSLRSFKIVAPATTQATTKPAVTASTRPASP